MNTQSTKHTPGPWCITEGQIEAGCIRIGTVDNADQNAGLTPKEAAANAALIAAAPDLLAAARKAREALAVALAVTSPDLFETDADIAEHMTIKALDAAIAKATRAATPKYGPNNPPRLRRPGESVKDYRAAMGWPT